ncbi:hypothetical protein CEXT_266001 [Caerostris extrusa]|uniref:Uncharacterized protein n=1 Tax=Caerostris extrusa TaxID=172846 RepID=A0AAV4TWE4_CAEEX|nr:hypothetical protein CEXT_266001 [Caerostris extrusa]
MTNGGVSSSSCQRFKVILPQVPRSVRAQLSLLLRNSRVKEQNTCVLTAEKNFPFLSQNSKGTCVFTQVAEKCAVLAKRPFSDPSLIRHVRTPGERP